MVTRGPLGDLAWNEGWLLLATQVATCRRLVVSSTSETDVSSSFHRPDMTLAVAEALSPNKNHSQNMDKWCFD